MCVCGGGVVGEGGEGGRGGGSKMTPRNWIKEGKNRTKGGRGGQK